LLKVLNDFIEGQAFLWSDDSIPLPTPLSRHRLVSLSESFCVSPVRLTTGRGGGLGVESYDGEKAWPSINNLILSYALSHMC
jgi:hypothetical protein